MLPEIEYETTHDWVPLPSWARYVWGVGEALAERPADDAAVICAISVPTRELVATLGTAAYLSVRSARDQLAAPHLIAPGTDILILHGEEGRIARVEKHGSLPIERRTGRQEFPGLWVLLENGVRQMIAYRKDLKLARAPSPFKPKAGKFRKVRVPAQTALGSVLLHGEPNTYASSTSFDSLLIGPLLPMRAELEELPLRVTGTKVKGTIGEIVRAQEALDGGAPWHCRMVSERGLRPPNDSQAPSLVTFDGVAGFRRWRHLYRKSDWLVVLDRGRNDYAEGVALVESEHARRAADADLALPPPPPGVELSLFKVRA